MAEENDGIGGYLTPTQGWRVYGPSSRTMRKMMRNQTTAQLLKDAAALTPDYGKVIEGIQKYKVDPVTAKWFENEANSKMKGYLNKYQDNPFWAFGREARETVSSLQRLANDPRLQYAESAYEMSKKEYDKHGEELQNINYDDGTVMVYDQSTGKSKRKSAFDLTENEIPLTGQDEFTVLTTRKGFIDGSEPFKVRVSKVSELRTRLHAEFNDSGYLKNELNGITTKSNSQALGKKLNSLLQNMGLSKQDQNTIYGQYVANAVAKGEKPTKQGANEYMVSYLKDVAEFKMYSERDETGGDGDGSGTGSGKTGQLGNVGHYESLLNFEGGTKFITPDAVGVTDAQFWNLYAPGSLRAGTLPLQSNPIFKSFAVDAAPLTDLKGTPLDKRKVIPFGSEAHILKTKDGRPMLRFDAFVHEDAANTDILGEYLNGDEETELDQIFDYYESNSERDNRFAKPNLSINWNPFDTEWKKVTVQVPFDANYAQEQTRNVLDGNTYYNPKAGYNLSGGGGEDVGRPLYNGK